jgi:hypothetical protein
MSDRGNSLSSFPLSAVLTVLTAIGGLLWFLPPLDSSRPAIPLGPRSSNVGYQDIDARLWQDPFEAVLPLANPGGPSLDSYQSRFLAVREQIFNTLGKSGKRPQILAVMVSGLPYAEDAESRLRARLAVVSGLARAGLRPNDDEHLGVIAVKWPSDASKIPEPSDLTVSDSDIRARDVASHILFIPYEWWTAQSLNPNPEVRDVLVLWLREEAFGDKPLRRLSDLAHALGPDKVHVTDMTLLGPAWSSTLRLMAWEADAKLSTTTIDAMKDLTILSASATASDDMLRQNLSTEWKNGAPTGWFKDMAQLKDFRRTIATDDVTSKALVDELKLRGLDFASSDCHIALIAEFDTLYGRWLPYAFARQVEITAEKKKTNFEHPIVSQTSDLLHWPECIERFSYLRGIDGRLPGDSENKSLTSEAKSSGLLGAAGITPPISSQGADTTEGHNQSDSLRRLADQISAMDRQYRSRNAGYIQAIGVLGSDVYDKLQILKALRKSFPGTLFFTTDLDARYSLATEINETHNLIVASPFDLRLNNDYRKPAALLDGGSIPTDVLQGEIPPFRDDYQTSIFLSTLLALHRTAVSNPSINAVRLFEIGQQGTVNLSTDDPIHPSPEDPLVQFRNMPLARCCLIVLACVVAYSLVIYYHGHGPSSLFPWKWPLSATVFILFLVTITIIFFIAVICASGNNGVPWFLFEGVSLWPTEALRLLAACFAIGCILDTHGRLRNNGAMIARNLGVDPPQKVRFKAIAGKLLSPRSWTVGTSLTKWKHQPDPGYSIAVTQLWREYQDYGSSVYRCLRVCGLVLLYSAFGFVVVNGMFVSTIFVPGRGSLSFTIDKWCTIFAALTLFTLNFYVGDAARLCKRLAQNLRVGPLIWPTALVDSTSQSRGMVGQDLNGYLTMDLLAHRTRVIRPLLYYPFIVLMLLILARNKYFDNWDWPPVLLAIFAAHLTYAVYQYVTLRRAAERIRQDTVQQLTVRFLQVNDTETQRKLKATLEEVTNLQEGIFASFAQNPVVGAILVPFAGLAGWLLIQLFMQAS